MKEVFGVTVVGVYCADCPATACYEPLIPASGGPAGRSGLSGAELITKDGRILFKLVFRICDVSVFERSFFSLSAGLPVKTFLRNIITCDS